MVSIMRTAPYDLGPLNTCVPLRQVTKLGPLSVHQKPSHAAIAILLCTCPWHGGEYNMRVMHIH